MYEGPEEINDDPLHAPSKLLEQLCPQYRKVAFGKSIAAAIGIRRIRSECPHFDEWLCRLEGCHPEKQ
jgi:hypothetical protein